MKLFALGVSVVLAMTLAYRAFHNLKRGRMMRDTPTTPMGAVRAGLTEVKGTVSAQSGSVTSPMKRTRCVYYRIRVLKRVKRSKGHSWVVLVDDSDHRRCLLEDGSGVVELNLRTADVDLDPASHQESGFMNEATADMEALLRRHGESSKGVLLTKTLKYEEMVLQEGDQVYALGDCVIRSKDKHPRITLGKHGLFIVSDKSEDQLAGRHLVWGTGQAALSVACVVGGLVAMVTV
jgi:hypothetical protein